MKQEEAEHQKAAQSKSKTHPIRIRSKINQPLTPQYANITIPNKLICTDYLAP